MDYRLKVILPIVAVLALVGTTFFPVRVQVEDGLPRVIIGNIAAGQEADYLCDGTNDNIQLQLALDGLPSTGGMVYVLAGNYTFEDGETVTRAIDNVSIVGIGGATSFAGDGTTPIFSAGGDRWLFMNLMADCGGIVVGDTDDWCMINVHNCTDHFAVLTDTAGGEMVEHGNEWHTVAFATQSALNAVISDLSGNWSAIVDLDDRLDDAELDILTLQVDVLELQGNVTDFAAWLGGNWSAVQDLQTDLAGNWSAVQDLQTDLAGNWSAVQDLQTDLAGNWSAVEDLQTDLAGNWSAVQDLQTDLAGNWSAVQDLGTALAGNVSALDDVGIIYVIDGGGEAISTGVAGFLEIPFACTITGWTIVADQSGSIVVDVWNDVYGNFPPTVADTIAGSEKPTISAATKGQDLSLGTWTTGVDAGDILGFNVDSCSTIERVTLAIRAVRVTT